MTLDDDVEAAVGRLQHERGLGRSEALNELARRGMVASDPERPYVHEAVDMGLRVDVTNIGDVLDLLDEL